MKIIYHCYGSAHSSIVSAAIHLGHLPTERTPHYREIMQLEDFDQARNDSLGHIFYKGKDEHNHEVYTMGMGPESAYVKRAMESMIKLYPENTHERIVFVHALPQINRMAKVGGALSRRYGWVSIGRVIAAKGICQTYPDLVRFVRETKKKLENG